MSDDVYENLADQLNALPNGFPRTKSGIEIRILKKIVPVEEAWLASRLTRKMETAEEIGSRLGLPVPGLSERLGTMLSRGLIRSADRGGVRSYWLAPFVVGLYESQLRTMDHDLAHLLEQYWMAQGVAKQILGLHPAIHRVIPARGAVEEEVVLPYEDARALLLQAKSYGVQECICRTEQTLLGHRSCSFPLRNCLLFSMIDWGFGSAGISQEGALAILDEAEAIGLVHTTRNSIKDVDYICNCCGCCCPFLRGVNEWGVENSVAKSNYFAEVEPDRCMGCEICMDRCQVHAISMSEGLAVVDLRRCIGCGLCVTGCPDAAVHLHKKSDASLIHPPKDFTAWEEDRLRGRNTGL